MGGRAESAVQLHCVDRKIRQAKATINLLKNKVKSENDVMNDSTANATVDYIMMDLEGYICKIEQDCENRGDHLRLQTSQTTKFNPVHQYCW